MKPLIQNKSLATSQAPDRKITDLTVSEFAMHMAGFDAADGFAYLQYRSVLAKALCLQQELHQACLIRWCPCWLGQ